MLRKNGENLFNSGHFQSLFILDAGQVPLFIQVDEPTHIYNYLFRLT